MENLKNEILELRKQKKEASDGDKKRLRKEILKLRHELENKTLLNAQKMSKTNTPQDALTDKQKSFYTDIKGFLTNWVDEKINSYLELPRSERKVPSKEGIKITIKRIAELLSQTWSKSTFSDLVFEFQSIKNGELYVIAARHDYLKKDM